eukprot:g4875.t1
MFTEVRIHVYEPLAWLLKAFVYALIDTTSSSSHSSSSSPPYYIDVLDKEGGVGSMYHARIVRLATLVFHVATTVLLYFVSLQLLSIFTQKPSSTSYLQVSCFLSSIFWGVLPVNVEVLAWPSAQPYAPAAFFCLLSVLCFLRKSSRHIYYSALFYVCAVLCKSSAVPLPAALVCIDVSYRIMKKEVQILTKPLKSFFTILLHLPHTYCTIFLVFLTLVANGKEDGAGWDNDTIILSWKEKITKVFVGSTAMFSRTVWPVNLRPHYRITFSDLELSSPAFLLSLTYTMSTLMFGIKKWYSCPMILATWVTVFCTILPVCGIVQHGSVQLGADRYMYLTSLVVIPLLAAMIQNELSKIEKKKEKYSSFKWKTVLLCFLTTVFAILTCKQTEIWRSDSTLHVHGLQKDPTDWRIMDSVIDELYKRNQLEDARNYIPLTLHFAPRRGIKALMLRAKLIYMQNDLDQACEFYAQAADEFNVITPALHNNIGLCILVKAAKVKVEEAKPLVADAIAHFRAGIALGSRRPRYMENLRHNLEEALTWDGQTMYKGSHQLQKNHPWTIPESSTTLFSIRKYFARLINTSPSNISLSASTSSALSNVSRNIHLDSGQCVIVLEDQNHSNVMPWQALVQRCKGSFLHVVQRPLDFNWTRAILQEMETKDVGLVALPHCHWSDGSMIDLEKISRQCEKKKVKLVLDLTQSIGVIPFNVLLIKADIIACSVHKWLLGPYGFCLLYSSPQLTKEMEPQDYHDRNRQPPKGSTPEEIKSFFKNGGAMLEKNGTPIGYTEDYIPGARKLDLGGRPNPIGLPMLLDALRTICSWHNDFDIAQYCEKKLTVISKFARKKGFRVPEWHSPHIVGLRIPKGKTNLPPISALVQWLKTKEKISVSDRMGAMRVCVHVYNTEEEITYFCRALERAIIGLTMTGADSGGQSKL